MKTVAMIEDGNWRILSWLQDNTWWMVLYYRGRVYKCKKFPTMDTALAWARDVKRRVDAGIESDLT